MPEGAQSQRQGLLEKPAQGILRLRTAVFYCIAWLGKLPRCFFGQALYHINRICDFICFFRKCVPNSLAHVSIVHLGCAIIPFLRTGIGRLLLHTCSKTMLKKIAGTARARAST